MHKSNYQDFSLIVLFGNDSWQSWDINDLEIQRIELADEEKIEYKTIYDNTCTFLIQKVTTVGKKTPENIIFYTQTHYCILLLVIYSTDKQSAVIINCRCFEIMVKL